MAAEGQKRLQKGVFGHLFGSLTPLCWDRKLFKNIIPTSYMTTCVRHLHFKFGVILLTLPNLLPADSGQLHLF